MEDILKDKRFVHITNDPKFKKIPKYEHKIKIDKRFQSMFKDKKFAVKYTFDKRGRPINQTSTENLRKYYDISSSEEAFTDEELNSNFQKSVSSEVASNLYIIKQDKESNSNIKHDKNSGKKVNKESKLLENNKLRIRKNTKKLLDTVVKKKLQDLNVDYARGEGILLSSSSSDESSECEDEEQEIDHNWGELDKEIQTTEDITNRLAVCNMDWDRIRAIDLMVLFNSFLPTGGLIHSVTIYPSEFGLQRMKNEELQGPIELTETTNKNFLENNKNHNENEEGLIYHMEKLRQYQLNRLKYYYAVIVFDSTKTANKIYTECDSLEYESSATKLDLRFIPNNMTFYHEPKEFCNELPDLAKYKPRQFITTALQQVKVDLTWDETNPERQEITHKLKYKKLDDIDENDIQIYLANGSSEDESEDKIKKQLEDIDCLNMDDNSVDKYKLLLKSIKQSEEEKINKEIELEFTWGLNIKEKAEKLIKKKIKKSEDQTPFQQYLEKRKIKNKNKREQKMINLYKDYNINESDSEDFVLSKTEIKNIKPKSNKRKNILTNNNHNNDVIDKEKKSEKAELELLIMDENKESNKYHFNIKKIEETESLIKSKKKRLNKKKRGLNNEANKDHFEVDVNDPRFKALFTSHHYNIDPTDSHYRRTKSTDALIQEKLKRRTKNVDSIVTQEFSKELCHTNFEANAEFYSLIKCIKRNTQNLKKA